MTARVTVDADPTFKVKVDARDYSQGPLTLRFTGDPASDNVLVEVLEISGKCLHTPARVRIEDLAVALAEIRTRVPAKPVMR